MLETRPDNDNFRCCIACLKDERDTFIEDIINPELTEIYKLFIQEEVSHLDHINLLLCIDCIEFLDQINEFKKSCLSAISSLQSQIVTNAVFFVKEEKSDPVLPEIKVEEPQLLEILPVLPITPHETSYDLRKQRKPKPRFPSPPKIVTKKPKKPEIKVKKGPNTFYCSVCKSHTANNHIIEAHATKRPNNKYECKICHKITSIASFKLHFYHHREFFEPRKCEHCEMTFVKMDEYQVHYKRHYERTAKLTERHKCHICNRSFATVTKLNYHLAVHDGALKCKYCDLTFFDKKEHDDHVQKELEKKDKKEFRKCSECDYKTKCSTSLELHTKKYHCPDAPLSECDLCGKTYALKNQLRVHMLFKHMEKQHQCSHCGRKFAQNTEVTKHIQRFHTQNISINCDICGKALKDKITVEKHKQQVHTNIRKYKCKLCDMEFKVKTTLKKHMHTHTKTRPYQCNLCSTGYYCNEYLRKHFDRKHDIIYTPSDIRRICGKMENREYPTEKG